MFATYQRRYSGRTGRLLIFLCPLSIAFARSAHCCGMFARPFHGRPLEMMAELHLVIDTLALQLLHSAKRLAPFRHRLLVDAVTRRQRPQALYYAVSLDGRPLSAWRSREEPGP